MTKNTKLARKIFEQLPEVYRKLWPGGVDNVAIHRLYPAGFQRSEGAWSWHLVRADTGVPPLEVANIGSQWGATKVSRGFTDLADSFRSVSLDPAS